MCLSISYKRCQLILLAILLPLLLSSCAVATKKLWQKDHYNEKISSFLVGTDGRYIVFLGERYHYILTDNSGILKKVLELRPGILHFNSKRSSINVAKNNYITGNIILDGRSSDLTPGELSYISNYSNINSDFVTININISGRRYKPRSFASYEINKNVIYYDIKIYEDKSLSKLESIGKAAITPLTLTVDAILTIGFIALVPFGD